MEFELHGEVYLPDYIDRRTEQNRNGAVVGFKPGRDHHSDDQIK